jgi:nitrite reductase/ring-hydroxylating ferredoxin subunit
MQRLICAATALADGGDGVRFEICEGSESLPAFVQRWQGKVYGYENSCAHVGLELDWNPGKFLDQDGRYLICAAHGALFEPDSGGCVAGPCAGRALRQLAVMERDGNIFLDVDLNGAAKL